MTTRQEFNAINNKLNNIGAKEARQTRALARLVPTNSSVQNNEKKTFKKAHKAIEKNKNQTINKQISGMSDGSLDHIIAMSIASPGSVPVQRWASQFSQKKTAIASPFSITNVNFGQSGGTYPQLLQAEFLAFLFRQPERAAIIYDQNYSNQPKNYSVFMLGGAGAVPSSTASFILDGAQKKDLITPYAQGTTPNYLPHGPVLYGGSVQDANGRFLWVDVGDQITVTASCSAGSNAIFFGLDYYGSSGYISGLYDTASTLTSTPIVITMKVAGSLTSGYYSFYLRNPAAAGVVTVTISNLNISGSGSTFCHLPVPYFANNIASVTGTRIIGESLMFTNTAAELNLGGEIASVQTGEADHWLDYVTASGSFALVAKEADSRTMNMKNGMYGFLKPTDPRDFDFYDDVDLNPANLIVDSTYSIDRPGSFLIMSGNCATAGGCLGYITIRASLEYMTTDPWREVDYSKTTEVQYTKALNYIKYLDQFHENPWHLSDLWSQVKQIGKDVVQGVKDYGPTVMNIASMLGKAI